MKKKAFTLAEVLITLSIIGIVAAMTIPTLIKNHQKQATLTNLKKSYSDLSEAIRKSEVDNNSLVDWVFNSGGNSVAASRLFFDTYLKPYMSIMRTCPDGNDFTCGVPVSGAGVNYVLSNGVGFSLFADSNNIHIVIDTNGSKKPNLSGIDAFYFVINKTNGLIPYDYSKDMTRDDLLAQCKASNRLRCTGLILYDGWIISSDYPWQ